MYLIFHKGFIVIVWFVYTTVKLLQTLHPSNIVLDVLTWSHLSFFEWWCALCIRCV